MIGQLRGKLIESEPNQLLIDVGGVGYLVEVPLSTYYQVHELSEEIILHIQMIVREDAQLLFGFYTKVERALFRLLIKVNSVGPKLAITVLSGIEPAEFIRVVANQDLKALVALPGVGKKKAEKIILELKDKVAKLGEVGLVAAAPIHDALADAEAALIGLGFKPQDAAKALAQIESNQELAVGSLIKQALKVLT